MGYKIKNNINLEKFGFKDNRDGYKILRFPVYYYRGKTVIECAFIVYEEDKSININVYTTNNMSSYAPYYNQDENNKVVKIINGNIQKMLNQIARKRR